MTVVYHKRRTGHSIFQISISRNVRFRLVFPDQVTYGHNIHTSWLNLVINISLLYYSFMVCRLQHNQFTYVTAVFHSFCIAALSYCINSFSVIIHCFFLRGLLCYCITINRARVNCTVRLLSYINNNTI